MKGDESIPPSPRTATTYHRSHFNDSPLILSSHNHQNTPPSPAVTLSTGRNQNKLFNRIARLFRRTKSADNDTPTTHFSSMASPSESHPVTTTDYSLQPAPLTRANAYTHPDTSPGPDVLMTTSSIGNIDVTDLPEYFVFVWGANCFGQLLTPSSKLPASGQSTVSKPQRIDRLAHRCITYLNCGSQSTWLVSDGGDIWAGGQNSKGQISPTAKDEPEIHQARHLEEFESMKVKSVASADEHTVLVSETGIALSYGTNEFGQLGHGKGTETLGCVSPKPMLGLKVPVSQACCGTSHTLILSTTGQVFSCGNSADGCLGLGDGSLEAMSTLQPIPTLLGIPIQQIAAGPEHSMALTLSGHIFSWGRNRKGRLGLGSDTRSIVYTPTCVESDDLNGVVFKHIATGPTHSAAIGPRGHLFLCGDNTDGQLGRQPDVDGHLDTFQPLDVAVKVRLVACGDRHTIIVNHVGEVYCFGRNMEGQLGQCTERPSTIWHPSPVGFEDETTHQDRRNGLYFYAIAAGRDHTAAVAVSFPPGICRQNTAIISTPVAGSDMSMTPDSATPTFQSSLSRLGSKITFLRQRSRPNSKIDSSLSSVQLDHSTLSKFGSSSLFHLPSILSHNPTRPALHPFQTLKSMGSMEMLLPGTSDAVQYAKKARQMVKVPEIEAPRSDDAEAHLPAGCSVGEILSLIESVRNSIDSESQFRLLKRRLTSVFSDPHRLNCSFLLPGRLPLLDVEGVEEIFDEIEKLDKGVKETLHGALYNSASDLLSMIEPYATLFTHSDQMRCIALVLQLRFLNNPIAANLRLLGRLSSVVFRFPEAGRRCLVDLFRTQYSANPFGQRLVAHVRAALNAIIKSQGGTSPAVWHGVVLFQLMFLSSMEWAIEQRNRAIEIAGRAQIMGKIPLEDFILDSINDDVDIAEELRAFRKFGATLETSQLSSGPRVNLLNLQRAAFPMPGGMRFQTATFRDATPPPRPQTSPASQQPTEGASSAPSTVEGLSAQKTKSIESIKDGEKGKKTVEPPTATSVITGRPRAIFDPSEALTVTELKDNWTFFLAHQNICPLKFKRNVIMVEALVNQQRSSMHSMFFQGHPFFFMPIRRDKVVEDALNIVLCSSPDDMLKPLKVIFDGEEGVDAGGLKREFFDIIVKTLFDPQFGMFIYNAEPRTIWFNRATIDTDNEFFLVGVVLGLALYNDNLLNLRFPNVVWKKLQDQPTGIEDLVDVFPAEGDSFMKILEWPSEKTGEFNDAFDSMAFEVQYDFFGETRSAELKPGGKEVALTYDNRKEYVDLYVNYLLNSSIREQFEAFKRGFLHFQTTLLKTLSAEELHLLVCGTTTLDFNEMREGTRYEGFRDDDPYIQDFWDILNELDIHQKKKFLRFCTGTDRVPLGGLKELALKIQRNGCEPTERLPTAYTCFNLLLLPEYSSKSKLQRLLVLAIEQSQGFGLQ